ncbi:Uncharacterised protein [Yersinia frederiksenii]|nr:Uncharacterised protein [Yersinia frederiksenii]
MTVFSATICSALWIYTNSTRLRPWRLICRSIASCGRRCSDSINALQTIVQNLCCLRYIEVQD